MNTMTASVAGKTTTKINIKEVVMLVIGFMVLVLTGLGIVLHAQKHGIKFFYTERFNLDEYLEQDRIARHTHYLKAEKKFWNNELKIIKAKATAEKYKIRRATDFLPVAIIKNALFHSKAKMSAVRPHTARKHIAGRRKSDGKSGLLDFGLAVSGIAFLIFVVSTPITPLEIPQYKPQEVIRVIEYAQPKTADDIAELQKELTQQSQAVIRKQDRKAKAQAQAKYNADKGTVIELY